MSAPSGNALLRLRECQKRIWVGASRRCDPNRNISEITRLRFFPFYASQSAVAFANIPLSITLSIHLCLTAYLSISFCTFLPPSSDHFALYLPLPVLLIAICNAARAPLSSHSGASLRDRSVSELGLMRLVSVA